MMARVYEKGGVIYAVRTKKMIVRKDKVLGHHIWVNGHVYKVDISDYDEAIEGAVEKYIAEFNK